MKRLSGFLHPLSDWTKPFARDTPWATGVDCGFFTDLRNKLYCTNFTDQSFLLAKSHEFLLSDFSFDEYNVVL